MDFKELKEQAIKLSKQAIEYKKKAVKMWIEKIHESSFTIKNEKDFEEFVSKNKNALVIFWNKKEPYFKKLLLTIPVIFTKSWVSNYSLKILDINENDKICKKHSLSSYPSMISFKEWKSNKIYNWEKEIMDLVKTLSLDIES